MAVGVAIPRRKQDDSLGKLLQVGGAVAGGIFGGPQGAMAGASAGGMAGGLLQPAPEAGPQPVETGAISRRMQQLDQSPLRQIRESINSLQYVQDAEQRAALAKPLLQADYMARQKA